MIAVLHTYSPGTAEPSAVARLAALRDRQSFRRSGTGGTVVLRAPFPGELGLAGRGWLIRARLGLGGVQVRQAFRVEPYRSPRGAGAPRVGPHRPTAVDLWNPPSPDAPGWAFEPDDEAAGAPHGASPDGGDR